MKLVLVCPVNVRPQKKFSGLMIIYKISINKKPQNKTGQPKTWVIIETEKLVS